MFAGLKRWPNPLTSTWLSTRRNTTRSTACFPCARLSRSNNARYSSLFPAGLPDAALLDGVEQALAVEDAHLAVDIAHMMFRGALRDG